MHDCCSTSTDRLVIEAVVDIARGLGKQTVAEHVGDGPTVALLRELGVTHGQGFYLGEPQPLEEFLAALQRPAGAGPCGDAAAALTSLTGRGLVRSRRPHV